MRDSLKKFMKSEKFHFLAVGGFCFILTAGINYALKLTALGHKPTTALIIATTLASIVSYILSSKWTWKDAGGDPKPKEMIGFTLVTIGGIIINAIPQWVSRYVFHLYVPYVSFIAQEVADFLSGLILGTLLAMFFRYWALDRFVFHGKAARQAAQMSETLPPADEF